LPKGAAADLCAVVITSGADGAKWTNDGKPGFTFISKGNCAGVQTADGTAIGSKLTVKAVSSVDDKKYDSKTVVVIDPSAKGAVTGGDGKLYADYGDNTFKLMDSDGAISGGFICGGMDRIPETEDDRDDITVSEYGLKYLGPNPDSSYQKPGPDGLLGTEDDEFVWKNRDYENIGPCNEKDTPPSNAARNIIISPASAIAVSGSDITFTATVYMSDGSDDPAGVIWEVQPAGSASITDSGVLTINPDTAADRIVVIAISKSNAEVKQTATVTV
jgi:hypothetical protein